MDDDFGFDDQVGRQTVELDDLPLDEERNMQIKFKQVSTSFEKYTKVTASKMH